MERNDHLICAVCTVLTAALMAGCAAHLAVRAMGFDIAWLPVYLIAAGAALAVQLGRRGMAWTIGAGAALVLAVGGLLAAYLPEILAAARDLSGMAAEELVAGHAAAGRGLALIAALVMGALFAGLLHAPGSAPLALLVLVAVVICALAINEELPLWMALPGLAAGVVAFGLPSDARRGGVRPALLLPGVLLVACAMLFTPTGRATWEPLEDLAQRIRTIVEDYVRFTEERVAFSINEKGYDRAGMVGDAVVAMLGGPADPSEDVVMRVETDEDLLLRGTIKRSYTGYSWVDDQVKARYLYYDFTHRRARDDIFSADSAANASGFREVDAAVEMLENGTSTLFVPAQLSSFRMGLADAVYYNSTGEIFLTRDVAPGDRYELSARIQESDGALIAAAAQREDAQDARYADARANYTALPEGIDSRVYALAVELTQDAGNAAEKAFAIENYLAQNYRYTLEGGYPPDGEDFVSWFLLEAGEGYCSYFASAMTVMCRIAGLPARYVEGYYVHAQPGGETIVTGRNAHAWVEVYLNGLGWIAFDPTARTVENQTGSDAEAPPEEMDLTQGRGGEDVAGEAASAGSGDVGGDSGSDSDGDSDDGSGGDPTPSPTPDGAGDAPNAPDATPTPDPNENGMDNFENSPTPTPDPQGAPDSGENLPENPEDAPSSPDGAPEEGRNRTWIWIALGILLLLVIAALALLWARRRLAASDPLKLCAAAQSAQTAVLILYRGMLTLLAQLGLTPMNGETPEAFAQRATLNMPNPDYEDFVSGVVLSRYSGREISADVVDAGRTAYVVFLNNMRRGERLRFHIRRMLHGIGDCERIP